MEFLGDFEEIGPRQVAESLGRAGRIARAAVWPDPRMGTAMLLTFASGAQVLVRPRMTEAEGRLASLAFFWKESP